MAWFAGFRQAAAHELPAHFSGEAHAFFEEVERDVVGALTSVKGAYELVQRSRERAKLEIGNAIDGGDRRSRPDRFAEGYPS